MAGMSRRLKAKKRREIPPQKGAIFRGDSGLPTPGDGSCTGESLGRGGKIDGNLSFGAALPKLLLLCLFCACFRCSTSFSFARDKRGIAVELKGKKRRRRDLGKELGCEWEGESSYCCCCLWNGRGMGMVVQHSVPKRMRVGREKCFVLLLQITE